MTGVLISNTEREAHNGEDLTRIESELGGLEPPEAEETGEYSPPEHLEEAQPCRHLDFGLTVLHHQVCGSLL